ncbi:hypothetical protein CEXT_372291 [Caerostris extrusa]|uniref:Uncharacterized protein n=1 Tax=Caerostris extrusa TaxID=172846 RepID=A0AAV4QRG5_CAEEX|nr:hypothetical protein CEXT_372291 [Caerostris extrusa]
MHAPNTPHTPTTPTGNKAQVVIITENPNRVEKECKESYQPFAGFGNPCIEGEKYFSEHNYASSFSVAQVATACDSRDE